MKDTLSSIAESASESAAAPSAESATAPRLSPQWQDWIAENLTRGCRPAEMVQVMVDSGYDKAYALSAITIFSDMAARLNESPVAINPISTFRNDPCRIAPTSELTHSDRVVGVGFQMASPNVCLLENLLSADECVELIEQSAGKLERSEVVNRQTGGSEVNGVRTSEGTHFGRGETATVRRIEQRIADVTGLPVENGEPLQILHYNVGGEYLAHHDYFEPADPGSVVHTRVGGQRVATLVIYLNTVEAGGETSFPSVNLVVKARAGSAVYFEYTNSDGELDSRCLHAGVPVEAGEKWIATKWLRGSPYVRTE